MQEHYSIVGRCLCSDRKVLYLMGTVLSCFSVTGSYKIYLFINWNFAVMYHSVHLVSIVIKTVTTTVAVSALCATK